MRAFNCVIVPLIALRYSFGFNLFVVVFVVICLWQLFRLVGLLLGLIDDTSLIFSREIEAAAPIVRFDLDVPGPGFLGLFGPATPG